MAHRNGRSHFAVAVVVALTRIWVSTHAQTPRTVHITKKNGREVFAEALRSSHGQQTLIIANDAELDWDAEIVFDGLNANTKLYRYSMTPEKKDKADVVLGPEKEFEISNQAPTFKDRLPARSLTVYSTYHLQNDEPGVIAE